MDYGKSGAPKKSASAPKHKEHNAYGTEKTPFGTRPEKVALIARMKAAVEAKKKA